MQSSDGLRFYDGRFVCWFIKTQTIKVIVVNSKGLRFPRFQILDKAPEKGVASGTFGAY